MLIKKNCIYDTSIAISIETSYSVVAYLEDR